VLWEFRNALWVFPLFLMGKIVFTYDQLELRPALANDLSSSRVYCMCEIQHLPLLPATVVTSVVTRARILLGATN
jgi:hypothetical protein